MGLPATGKSTLARLIAARYGFALLRKDAVKEPLLDVIGANDRAESRRLSDASFAVLFSIARECLASGAGLVLEGNFRPGEHEASVLSLFEGLTGPRITQVVCRAAEAVRVARLQARVNDPSRHSGHRDAALAAEKYTADVLSLPGERLVFDTDDITCVDDAIVRARPLLSALDQLTLRKS
ncbi:MAG TPA: AAA family ATPase [Steroidobacteraceae bacterium]|nr:AAA family ATPase [Steroidobacteraceae bacterium]